MLMKYLPRQISVSSCAMTGDRIWRKLSHKRYIWTVCHQCVYGSGGSAHLISQTARCSLPMYIHTASPLVRKLIILGYRSLNVWMFMQKNKVASVAVWGMCTCVCPSVGFQVRTLCVDFIAAFEVTPVDPPFLFSVYESITSCCHLKWLTVRSRGAGGAHHFKLTENKIQDLSLLLMPLKCF